MASILSNKHIEYALELIVSIEIDGSSAAQHTRDKLAKWRMSKPEHELAYHEAIRQWQLIGNIAPELKEQFHEPGLVTEKKRSSRNLLALGSLLICGGLLAKAGIWYWHQPIFEQNIHTNVAQRQTVDLPDGTHLDINAHSNLHIRLYRQKREVTLNSGEVHFTVSHNADSPFAVHTREGDVKVVGTIFTVADRGKSVKVTVEQGHVQFQGMRPATAENTHPTTTNIMAPDVVDLYANEYVIIRDHQHGAKTHIDTTDIAAWRDGWLVFNNTALEDAIPEINAYRDSPIMLGNYKTSRLRLTGRFLANDSQQLEKALPKILHVKVKNLANGITVVTGRD